MGKRKQPEPSSEVADEPVTLSVGQQVAHIKNRQKRSEEYGKLKHKKQVRCRQLYQFVPAWPKPMLWVSPSTKLPMHGDACRRRSASGERSAGQMLPKQSSSGWSRHRSKSPGSVGPQGHMTLPLTHSQRISTANRGRAVMIGMRCYLVADSLMRS